MTVDLFKLSPEDLRDQPFIFLELEGGDGDGNRIEVYEEPLDWRTYVLGFDSAYGIPGRDWDAAIILDQTAQAETGRARQVGELHGHWGPEFDIVLYAALLFWNEAFCIGERQVGLFHLDRLWNKYGYRWMYYQRDPTKPGRPKTQKLGEDAIREKVGHHSGAGDSMMRNLRLAVRDDSIDLRSRALMQQMGKLQYRAPEREQKTGEREPDTELKMKLIGGGSPDLVKACAFTWHACREIIHYDKPTPAYPEDSLGELLEHHVLDEEGTSDRGGSWANKRRNRR